MKLSVSVVILTYNEEKNIEDCLKSVHGWTKDIFIVDSYSTDRTLQIAREYTDKIFQHKFETHSKQWKWAIENLTPESEWILGLDADQRVSDELREELSEIFKKPPMDVDGFYVRRKQIFFGRWIKFGGYYPKYLLKIFRRDKVRIDENELVDHHFYIQGTTRKLNGDIIEDNLKERDLSFWLQKHIRYGELFVLESINKRQQKIKPSIMGSPDQRSLFFKDLYLKLPLFVRPFLYFAYRYFFKLGFLDGKEGLIFHFLQGLWFRFLVDAKIYEVRVRARAEDRNVGEIIYEMLESGVESGRLESGKVSTALRESKTRI